MEGAGEVFSYNREGFMFDREQNQKREYQGQNMRIAQYEMYRQDVDDLVNLTVSKMDNYLLVNTLMFNFCIVLLTEGRPKAIAPPEWLLWLYGMTTMGAILYIVMGMWLALHASVAAHSFGARILTQCVRLPVPNKQQLDAARFFATEYEAGDVIGLQQGMLRLPLLERLNNAMEELIDTGEAQEPNSSHPNSAGMLEHFRIFRRLQANWQAYDAYTRVCMSAGVNQLIHAFIYSTLVILVTEASSPLPALCFALVLASCSWLVTRLDLFLSRRMLALVGTFVAIPPVLAWAAITIQTCGFTEMHDAGCQKRSPRYLVDLRRVLVPVIYVLHIGWIVLIIRFGRAQQIGEVALPTAFRSVLYLDVFGWLSLPSHESRQGSAAPSRQVSAAEASSVPMGVAVSRSSTARHLLDAVPEEPEVAEREPETLLGELESQVMARTSTRRRRQLSSGDSTTRSVSPHRSIRPPDAVRSSLEESCERQLAELRRHLECWETEAVQACIREDPYFFNGVRATRECLDKCVEQLAEVAPELVEPAERTEAGAAWLTLEWDSSGTRMNYYVRSDTGELAWSRPREAVDRVYELEDLRLPLKELQERVQAVVEMRGAAMAAAAEAADEEQALAAAAREAEATPSEGAAGEQAAGRSPRLRTRSSRSTARMSEQDYSSTGGGESFRHIVSDDEGPAQETRFGGRESVELAQQQGFDQPASFSPDAAHPQAAQGEPYRTPLQRKPGRIPWRCFLHGSCALLTMWCTKCAWDVFITVTGINIPIKHKEGNLTIRGPERVFAGSQWPDELFRPSFLACHAALDAEVLLVGDRFSVHELRLGGALGADEPLPAVRPVLRGCLSGAPEFHAGGVRGLALDCAPAPGLGVPAAAVGAVAEGCTAVLLGANLQQGLRCSVGEAPNGTTGDQPGQATLLTLHGGPYQSLASAARGSGALWAQEAGGAVVRLRTRGGAAGELVPHFEIGRSRVAEAPQLQLVLEEEGALLAVEPGRLVAERLRSGGVGASARLWSAPLPGGLAWRGGCAAGGAVYLLGREESPSGGGGAAGVWRIWLPP